MTPADLDAIQARDLLTCHGEPVTLPSGAVVTGVFDPIGQAPGPFGSEVGLGLRLGTAPNPSVHLSAADAAELASGSLVVIRGAEYRVTALADDGAGLIGCELMPAGVPVADGEFQRWR